MRGDNTQLIGLAKTALSTWGQSQSCRSEKRSKSMTTTTRARDSTEREERRCTSNVMESIWIVATSGSRRLTTKGSSIEAIGIEEGGSKGWEDDTISTEPNGRPTELEGRTEKQSTSEWPCCAEGWVLGRVIGEISTGREDILARDGEKGGRSEEAWEGVEGLEW